MKEKLLLWDGVDSPLAKLVYNLLLRYSDIYNYLVDTTIRKGDCRLSPVEKKTLQKRRAITIFDPFRLLGDAL